MNGRRPVVRYGNAAPEESEAQFQARVRKLLTLHGYPKIYHTKRSKGSDKGFPDLVAVSVRQKRRLFIELKRESAPKKIPADQLDWHDHLVEAGAEAYIWRPSQWRELERIIAGLDR